MGKKTIKLTLEAVPDTDVYIIRQVTNSVEWTPGEFIDRLMVKGILNGRSTYIDVVINAPKK